MDVKPSKNKRFKNLNYKIKKGIYISIKRNIYNSKLFFIFVSILEIFDQIIFIDIIFKFKRIFINLYFCFYFLSPTFYYEILNSKFGNNSNILNNTYYETDQIYLIQKKYLKIEPISQVNFKNNKIIKICVLIFIIFLFAIQLLKEFYHFISIIKKISIYLLYFFFISLIIPTLLIFNRQILIQFSSNYGEIKADFIYDLILMIIFNFLLFKFYDIFIYAYDNNEYYFLIKSNYFIVRLLAKQIGVILIVFRNDNKYFLIFQVIWSGLSIISYYIVAYIYLIKINNNLYDKIIFYMKNLVFSLFFIRFVNLFLIKSISDKTAFKILEIFSIILFSSILFFKLSITTKYYNIELIQKYLKDENSKFFIGLFQVFNSILKLYAIKKRKKLNEQIKDTIYFKLKNELYKFFILSEKDLTIISENNSFDIFNEFEEETKEQSQIIKNGPKKNKIDTVIELYLLLLNNFYKLSKLKNNKFSNQTKDLLTFYKIILYYATDVASFRAEFYLKKYLYSKKYNKDDLIMNILFKNIENIFKIKIKTSDDNSMDHLIYFNLLTIEYIKLMKSLKIILINFDKTQNELFKIIDTECIILGEILDKIIELNRTLGKTHKIREQPENDKFKFIENILFNSNYEKGLEYFDTNILDSLIEQNTYFIISNIGGEYICKKAPLLYKELTGNKTSKLFNRNFFNIFPYLIRNEIKKKLETKIINNKICKIDGVLESIEHFIVYCKLTFNTLPSYKGLLFYICYIETISPPDNSNHILIQSNGEIILFGMFFKMYFGFSNSTNNINLFKLFGIKNYNINQQYVDVVIPLNDLIKKINNSLGKDGSKQNSIDVNNSILKLKKEFSIKNLNIRINFKTSYKIREEKVYLLNVFFLDLNVKGKKKNGENIDEESLSYLVSYNNNNSIGSFSSNSYLSSKILKENSWNITNKKNKRGISKNLLDLIMAFYNIFLIILAIVVCIIIKFYSDNFKIKYKDMLILNSANSDYLISAFFITIISVVYDSNDKYLSLNNFYENKIENYNITLEQFYSYEFKKSVTSFIDSFYLFKREYGSISKKNELYPVVFENLTSLSTYGQLEYLNYLSSFEVKRNYFYILSHNDEFYHFIPQINYYEIPEKISSFSQNQKYIFTFVYNSVNFFIKIFNVIGRSKKYFEKKTKEYKFVSLFLFIGFLIFNIFSLFLLFFSIQITNKKMLKIVKNIFKLTKKRKNFLIEKLKLCKISIQNEIKYSLFIDKIKEIDPKKKILINIPPKFEPSMGEFVINENSNSKLLNNNNNNNINNNNNDEDDNLYLISTTNNDKKLNYNFKTYNFVITILVILCFIYIIYLIITICLVYTYFNKFNVKIEETNNISDLQNLLLIYNLVIKISILSNNSNIHLEYDTFGRLTKNIYSNYSNFKKILLKENNRETVNYFNSIINYNSSPCNILLDETELKYSLIKICDFETFLQTNLETMIGGYVNQLRKEYINFNISKKGIDDIINCFHSENLQRNNLKMIIYFLNFLKTIEEDYILPQLNDLTDNLTIILIVLFIVMVITEVIYYFGSSFLVTKRLSETLNIYVIMDKFFGSEETKEKK